MNTRTFVVQHEWDSAKINQVMPVVSGIVENSKAGRLPKGLSLVSVMLSKDSPKAYCVWKSESKETLEHLLASVNPPTKHTVSEFEAVYGIKAGVPLHLILSGYLIHRPLSAGVSRDVLQGQGSQGTRTRT